MMLPGPAKSLIVTPWTPYQFGTKEHVRRL
jgi:hypothetical protein